MGDKLLLKLNIDGKPIANKYYEGKMKRTLKRGLKDLKSLSRKRLEGSHLQRYWREQARSLGGMVRKAYFSEDNGQLRLIRKQKTDWTSECGNKRKGSNQA